MYQFASGQTWGINSYQVTSSGDYANRDPKDWRLQGCNGSCTVGSDTGWTTIDSRSGQVFSNRYQPNAYQFANSTAYAKIRLRITANAGSTANTQVGELQIFNSNGLGTGTNSVYLSGGTVTATNPGTSPTDMTKAFDNDATTKWHAPGTPTPTIVIQFPTAKVATAYNVVSAGDSPTRDPSDWFIEGSNDGTQWSSLHTEVGYTFPARNFVKQYALLNTTAYTRYRVRVTGNNGSSDFQVGDVQLFGF